MCGNLENLRKTFFIGKKSNFNFLHTFCEFRTCMYTLKYILKNCHHHSYGFQNLMSSWGWGTQFSKLQYVREFWNIRFQKSSFFFFVFLPIHHFFWKSQKRFFQCRIEKKSVLKLWNFFLFFIGFRRKLGTG